MNKTLLILRHEVTTLTGRFSFWFSVLGLPLLGLVIIGGIGMVNHSQGQADGGPSSLSGVQNFLNPPENTQPQGYIDHAGIIQHFPDDSSASQLTRYSDPAAAQRDLNAGKIGAYYIIPPDYVQSGKLYLYTINYNLIASELHSQPLRALIAYNLLQGDAALAHAVAQPLAHLSEVNLSPDTSDQRDPTGISRFILPYLSMLLFYIAIMGSSTMMLNSITKEKENRIMEVLMASVSPHQLLLGKIGGLGLVGLLQMVIWGGSSFAILKISGQTLALPANFNLQPSILAWGLGFFVLGFLIYASLMAGVGALVPNLREASQLTFLVMLPLMIPLFVISALVDLPNGPLAVALSLFPLTAPTVMMLRMAATQVPVWQLLLSLLLLGITSLLIIRVVAGMFRAQTLLSGQPFRLKRLFFALLGRG